MKELKGKLGKIYNENCITTIKRLEDNSINLVVTSPPYNVNIDYDVHNDTMEPNEYFLFIRNVFTNIYDKLSTSGRCAINVPYEVNMKKSGGGRVFMIAEYWKILESIGFQFAGLVDLKEISSQRPKLTAWGSWLSPSAPYIYNPKECVIILYKDIWKRSYKGTSYFDKTQEKKKEFMDYVFGMWEYQAETRGLTKANFSLDIPLKAIKILSWGEDIIYDPFMGSGTTALACEILNRKWIGSEISKEYYEISIKRINEFLDGKISIETFFEQPKIKTKIKKK